MSNYRLTNTCRSQNPTIIFTFLFIVCSAQYQHRAVLENDAFENLIPSHYRNPLLKTPRFLHALAKSTWFGPGEHPVYNREADKIHRSEIYTVLTHAGFIERQIGRFQ